MMKTDGHYCYNTAINHKNLQLIVENNAIKNTGRCTARARTVHNTYIWRVTY